MHKRPRFIPLNAARTLTFPTPDRALETVTSFTDSVWQRRTVREYSDRPVPRAVIEQAIRAAGSAPSGANLQPWHFVAVSDPHVKRRIREAAEIEERAFYAERAPKEWLNALSVLGTDEHKPFLEVAPWLIAVFAQNTGVGPDGHTVKNYYVSESVGIATGLLITALHLAGLVTLTHTPSPMGFLRDVLGRPKSERAYLLVVAGYPADDAEVPDIQRKQSSEIATFLEGS